MKCMNCDSKNDVINFHKGGEEIILCVDCRYKLATGQQIVTARQIGRPSLGVTKKVSLTLPAETWEYLDNEAEGNRSEFLRKLIERNQWNRQEWSNNAALGYAIFGAAELGYTEEQTQKLIRAIYKSFDFKTLDEAKENYNNSPY